MKQSLKRKNKKMQHNEDLIICRCEEITLGQILQAIKDGATTLSEVKRRTRAGMGLCQGKTCQRIIANLISAYTGIPMKDILPYRYRYPVRPVKLSEFINVDD